MVNINISIDENDVIQKDEDFNLVSGMYKISIIQARLKQSSKNSAQALSLLCDIIRNESKQELKARQEFDIWFLNSNSQQIDFGVSKIGSLLYLLGLPMKISNDCFIESNIKVKEYNAQTNQYDEIVKKGFVFKELTNKQVWVVIGIKYNEFNGKLIKKYDLNSFYNENFKSVSEIKWDKEPKKWKYRLEYCSKIEKETYNGLEYLSKKNQSLDSAPPYAVDYSSPSYDAHQHPIIEPSDEEIPF